MARKTSQKYLKHIYVVIFSSNDIQHWSVMFSKSEKKNQWEQMMLDTKQKLSN